MRPFQKPTSPDEAFESGTPPPSYGTLYDPSMRRHQMRNNQPNNIWTTGRLAAGGGRNGDGATIGGVGAASGAVHRYINGRQYRVQRDTDGREQLVPMGTPSATLFQYQYSN